MSPRDVTDARPSFASEKEKGEVDATIRVEGAHDVELERRFGFFSCLGLAFALLNSWTGKCGPVVQVLTSQPCTLCTPRNVFYILCFADACSFSSCYSTPVRRKRRDGLGSRRLRHRISGNGCLSVSCSVMGSDRGMWAATSETCQQTRLNLLFSDRRCHQPEE
jgi:hypothetical protein